MKKSAYTFLKRIIGILTLTAVLGILPAVAGEAESQTTVREDVKLVTLLAEVVAIDHETRDITLADEYGKELEMVAAESIQRLDEVEVGDFVKLAYYLSIAYDLREPTPDELENPLQIIEDAERAGMDEPPGGIGIEVMKAVCTIEGLDRPTATVTLKGPLGGLNVVQVKDVSNLPKLRIGQSVVVTFTQAVAIALEKVAKEGEP
jgi:Cu/Ag efflux protein CusF